MPPIAMPEAERRRPADGTRPRAAHRPRGPPAGGPAVPRPALSPRTPSRGPPPDPLGPPPPAPARPPRSALAGRPGRRRAARRRPGRFGSPEPVRVDASDYGLGIGGDDPSGELADAGARRGITEAEAQARLGELAASRAAREPEGRLAGHALLAHHLLLQALGPDALRPRHGRPAGHADLRRRRRRGAPAGPRLRVRQRGLHPGRGRRRPHLRAHALLLGEGRPDRARRRPDRPGGRRGLLHRPAPALRDPPGRPRRPPTDPQAWLENRGVKVG